MSAKRKYSLSLPGAAYRLFCLAVLSLLEAACAATGPAAVPTPQVFDLPARESGAVASFFIEGEHFGSSVDIDGDVMAAGAPKWGYPGEGAGAVHVFRRSSEGEWQAEADIFASDRDDGFQYDQHFGAALALVGSTLFAGAPFADDPVAGDNTGAVYIFEYNGSSWLEKSRLTPSRPTPGGKFGSVIDLDGDTLAVSGFPESDSVFIFQQEAGWWHETGQVPVPASPDGEPYHVLIDLYGDTLALSTVTTYAIDQSDHEALIQSFRREGMVTLYEREGEAWEQTFQIASVEAALYIMSPDLPYGIPVALGGEAGRASLLAVGKPGFTESGREQGSVAIYARRGRGWVPQAELMLAPGEPVEGALPFFGHDPGPVYFGAFVEIEDQRLAVISTFANTAYLFEHQGVDWKYQMRLAPDVGDDFMRRTVALSGDTLVLGSPGDLGGGDIFVFNIGQ